MDDYKWLIQLTGDPLADTGGYTIRYLYEETETGRNKKPMDLIDYIAKIYVKLWGGKINAFFLNSPITQPAFKADQKIKETLRYFSSLLDDSAEHIDGYCRITGQYTHLFKSGRDNSIMTGSGTFVNFHHAFQPGIMLSKEAIIRMFFVPFGVISVGGKIAVIQSNDNEVNYYFVKKNCEENLKKVGAAISSEVLKSDMSLPANALFDFIDDLLSTKIKEASDHHENLSLALYHFTNFGASPETTIYRLPMEVFQFYSVCNTPRFRETWQPFLRAHYRNAKYKDADFDPASSVYFPEKKKSDEILSYDTYRKWKNIVLENLLEGKSLLKLFLEWIKAEHKLNFGIIENYLKIIYNMNKETIAKIKELAKFLAEGDEDTVRKNIRKVSNCKNAYELRRFFLKNIVATNYENGARNPIITLEDMVYYLFPDNISWMDIRTFLLTAVYQELHAASKIIPGTVTGDETDETGNEDADENEE